MERRKLNGIAWGFAAVALLVVGLMLMNTLRQPVQIILPDTSVPSGPSTGGAEAGGALSVVEVTPESVQAAIATLSRPEVYRRTVTVEQFWSGGSGAYETTVTVSGSWTRIDRAMPDGRVRHTIIGDELAYIWYDDQQRVYAAPVGIFTADSEQSIPTYEEILELPEEAILAADYRTISEVNCIFVETAEDQAGYVWRYWVSVDTGLLAAAEKLLEGEPVYRMGALTVDQSTLDVGEFTLPDGTVLR